VERLCGNKGYQRRKTHGGVLGWFLPAKIKRGGSGYRQREKMG